MAEAIRWCGTYWGGGGDRCPLGGRHHCQADYSHVEHFCECGARRDVGAVKR